MDIGETIFEIGQIVSKLCPVEFMTMVHHRLRMTSRKLSNYKMKHVVFLKITPQFIHSFGQCIATQ